MKTVHLVKEIWIISESGIPIYNQATEENVDKDLFGGFIKAIDAFIHNLGDECKRIEMGDSQLLIEKCKEASVLVVCRSGKKIKSKKIEKYLGKIIKEISAHHHERIKTWDGNTDEFDDFSSFINIKEDPENYLGVKLNKETSKQVLDLL